MEDHLPRLPRGCRCFVVGAVEVERQLASGDRPEGLGAAYIQRLGRPERLQRLGTLGHGGVEVEGISHIQGAPDVGVPVETGAGLPDVERPAVRGGLAAALGLLGHELGDRGLDQPVELTDAEPVRKRRDPGIHEPAASIESDRVALAIHRAFHATRSPAATRFQTRGSR